MQKPYLTEVQSYALSLLTARTPVENYYHDSGHTQEVVQAVLEIGKGEKLSENELEIVQIAGWFHDLGYIEKVIGHEKRSIEYAKKYLSEINYPLDKTKKIIACIKATRVPQNPKSKLEKILCDADLSHFGKETFFIRNEKYRVEFENLLGRKLSEIEWIKKTIDFVKQHHFFTKYALKNFSKQKKENLRFLQDQLKQFSNKTK